MKKPYLIVLVLVIIGALAFWYWNSTKESSDSFVAEENAVLIEDQQPGTETTVTYAKLAQPGYVTVYATDASGTKTLLGSSDLLQKGEHRNVKVRHSGGSSSNGSTVSAEIVVDDGDGTFSEESDTESVAEDNASISVDAVLDTDVTDGELAELLDDAGYDVSEEVSVEEETVTEETPNTEEEVSTEQDSQVDTAASTEETVEAGVAE